MTGRRGTARFARVVIALGITGAATVVPAASSAPTPAAIPFVTYGADASGTGVHLLANTNALSNFRNGVVDNQFPLAATHLDASPATTGTASIGDTGPAGGFLDFEANGKLPQTQYALAGYPGQPTASVTQQGTIATAAATPTSADARSAVLSTTSGGPTATESTSAAADGDFGESHVSYDQAAGMVHATGIGSVAHAVIAGVLTVDGLTVTASVVTDGVKATPTYAITATSIKVAGTPVSVTDKGIAIASPMPALAAVTTQLVDSLNGALAAANIKITTTAPNITLTGSTATVDATGITVSFKAPDPTPSIPSLSGEVILGEARAFAFGTPGVAPPSTPTPAPAGPTSSEAVGTSPTTGSGPSVVVPPAVVETPPSAAPSTGPTQLASGLQLITNRRKPTYLLFLYLAWQTLIIGTCAAVVWWRLGERARA